MRFPRRSLAQRFAVLLMQSCYRAADGLDFVPMVRCRVPAAMQLCDFAAAWCLATVIGLCFWLLQPIKAAKFLQMMTHPCSQRTAWKLPISMHQDEFQVRFWKLRQAAYGDYVRTHSGLQIRQVREFYGLTIPVFRRVSDVCWCVLLSTAPLLAL